MSCRSCGTPFGPDDTFCAKCGVRVTPPPPTWPGTGATQAGVQLGDDDDLMFEKVRETTVGEYEVRALLGRGGMASVFVAYDLTLNRKVALKVMHPGLLGDSGMRERFRLEARMAARLDHPNIVTVHSVKERGSIVFFDLKLIDGTSLDRLLRYRNAPMPVNIARWATSKIAEALHYAHGEGIVHRDMKPANVMVERRGDCIVTDFGIAKAAESPSLTMTGAVVGTPAYMSPEQCLGEDVTAASDQYSLGIMAYELLTGQVPYAGSMLMIQLGHVEKMAPAPHEVVPTIPKPVSDVVMRMIAKKPADRWPTLALAAEALIEGISSTDAQMRREMSMLVQELPADLTKSLPATPRTPSLALSNPMGTQALAAASRVEEASTQIVVPTFEGANTAATTMPTGPAGSAPTVRTVPVWKRKQVALPALGVLVVGGALAATLASGSGETTQAPAPVDSVALASARAAAAAESAQVAESLFTQRDTNIVRVSTSPINLTLAIGDSARVNAFGVNRLGETIRRPVKWTSSDSIAVTIDQAGWVRAVGKPLGGALVFVDATTAGLTSSIIVTVR